LCPEKFFRPISPFGVVSVCFSPDNILLLLMFLKSAKERYTFNLGNLLKLRLIIDEKWFSQDGARGVWENSGNIMQFLA
jgi:hypothetical protein